MIPSKTTAGQQVLKDRSVALTPRQRAALILIDGKRSLADVLRQTTGAGVTPEDLELLFDQGLVTARAPEVPETTAPAPITQQASPQDRYAAAYPIAARLTAGLGLRGFRLNLAVEAATNFDDLVALAPRIRDAVGAERFAPLGAVLTPH
jgi:hypothetical protein